MSAKAAKFGGWKGDFQGFFLGLQVDNSKAYFDAHRRQYEEEVKQPMVALLAELEAEFGPVRLSRPNRDIRFAADKSPYKTNIYASVEEGGYVSLDAKSLVAAGGRYMVETDELARYRKAVAGAPGAKLIGMIGALRKKGYDISGQELKRVPPPYPQLGHPLPDLRRGDPGPYLTSSSRSAEAWRDGAELNAWLARHMQKPA